MTNVKKNTPVEGTSTRRPARPAQGTDTQARRKSAVNVPKQLEHDNAPRPKPDHGYVGGK